MTADDLAFALELADLADSLSLVRFRAADLRVETKADLTPVTDADRSVERALRERIGAERPGEGVFGEEEGDTPSSAVAVKPRPLAGSWGAADAGRPEGTVRSSTGPESRRASAVSGGGGAGLGPAGAAAGQGLARWILDPIDGTRNFSRGIPLWATLIALERDGELVCGVVSAPALGHRWWAARGLAAWRDGERIGVSRVARLEEAAASCAYARDLVALEAAVWHARAFGDFWQHMLVAEGALDASIEARLEIWDYAAVVPIVEEAGGRMTDLDGGPPRPGEQIVCSNGVLHDDVLALLRASNPT